VASIAQSARKILAQLVEQTSDIPTFAATVMIEDRIVLEHNADRRLCGCSTLKVASATAVMTIVQDGAVDLDRPAVSYDSGLKFSDARAGEEITIRQLLSHTSGLSDTDQVEADPHQCLAELGFVARPGRAFHYSNVAFDIGVLTASRVAGLSEQDFLRARVFAPLAMHDTKEMPDRAYGVPFTTARDLIQLAREHLGGHRLLCQQFLSEMHRIHADSYTARPCRYYGLGINVEHFANRTMLSHGGGLDNYGTAFLIDPAARAAVAMLFDDPAGYAVSANTLLDRILDRCTLAKPDRPNSTDWGPYIGHYSNGAELFSVDDQLKVRWKGKEHALEAVDERLYASKMDGVSVGLLEGSPTMISVNDFILIGATPGVRLG
jgi:CubicO group peptidase (beta-lactamase class C family)